jgi:hypothetical protein
MTEINENVSEGRSSRLYLSRIGLPMCLFAVIIVAMAGWLYFLGSLAWTVVTLIFK